MSINRRLTSVPVESRVESRKYVSEDSTNLQQFRTESSRYKALDTLRGVAALSVTFLHLSFAVQPVSRFPLHLCVDFFLVLSGFVLARTYTYSQKVITPIQFMGHRFARLWPLQAYTAVATFLVRWLIINQLYYTPYQEGCLLFAEILLLNGLGLPLPEDINNPPSWTVSCEFWINVPFAFLLSKNTPPIVMFVVAALGQGLLFMQAGSLATTGGYFGLIRCSSSFLLGIGGYMLHRRLLFDFDCEGFSTAVMTTMEAVLSFLLFCVFAESRTYASTHDFFAPWIFVLVVMCFAREQGFISKALCYLELLGTISYSIYLNHRALLALLWPNGPNQWLAGITWTQPKALALFWMLLLPYSYLTYRVVERPSNWFLRGVFDEWVQEAIGFDGQWLHRGEIKGAEFIALNGSTGSLVKTGPKTLTLSYEGQVCSGELREDGHLHWADGDTWIRCRAGSVVVAHL